MDNKEPNFYQRLSTTHSPSCPGNITCTTCLSLYCPFPLCRWNRPVSVSSVAPAILWKQKWPPKTIPYKAKKNVYLATIFIFYYVYSAQLQKRPCLGRGVFFVIVLDGAILSLSLLRHALHFLFLVCAI